MVEKTLSWNEILEKYSQEWVQLVDFNWPEHSAYPESGVVRVHSANRKEFNRLVLEQPPKETARIFVGEAKRPKGEMILKLGKLYTRQCE